jgi:hypothetical protein
MTEPLFPNAYAALKFAYRFSLDQYDRPMMNRMADGPKPQGKGLVGIDGAAQAGMIRGEVAQLGRMREAIVTACYAPKTIPCSCRRPCCSGMRPNSEFEEAISRITEQAITLLSGHLSNYRLRRAIVLRNFGVKPRITEIAGDCGVHRDTVSEQNVLISQWLSGTRSSGGIDGEIEKARESAVVRLESAGIVPSRI